MVNVAKPDERSVMTYVTQFVHYYITLLQKETSKSQQSPQQQQVKIVEQNEENTFEETIDGSLLLEISLTLVESEPVVKDLQTFTWEEVKLDGYLYKQDVSWFKMWKKKYFSILGTLEIS